MEATDIKNKKSLILNKSFSTIFAYQIFQIAQLSRVFAFFSCSLEKKSCHYTKKKESNW